MPSVNPPGMTEAIDSGFWRINRLVFVTVSALASLLVGGTVVYHYLEGWSWISSFYFTACTLTTVGYGDLFPTTDVARLFTAVFALAGVAIAFASLSILGTIYLQRSEDLLSKVRESRNK
jgi:voltage-gated potassium channel